VNHDGLAEGVLNHGYCTAVGFLQPWKPHLTNSHGLLQLLIARMELDWTATQPKMRKPWNVKDLDTQLILQVYFDSPLIIFFDVLPGARKTL